MSVVTTHACDVCLATATSAYEDYPGYAAWGKFEDRNAQSFEVCATCMDRLLEPYNARHGLKPSSATAA